MTEVKGVTFEKDTNGYNRFVRIDMLKYGKVINPILQQSGIKQYPDGWEDGLTSEEFLAESKALLKKKFDDRNKVS